MNLLIVTQKADTLDSDLGFFHRWIEEFAKKADRVWVIAGLVGDIKLPYNVEIFSLGKETGGNKFFRVLRIWRLYSKYYTQADAVFFHMIPEFVLAAAPWIILRKTKTALWYTHKKITFKLRIAEKLVDHIFTASKLSFRLKSKKITYTGHAIDTDLFNSSGWTPQEGVLRILTAGRVSPVKELALSIRACAVLKKESFGFVYSLVGGSLMPGDDKYLNSLKELVKENGLEDKVFFAGPVSYPSMAEVYQNSDLFISLSSTGSIDKSVLEAMSCGVTVITSNEAFRSVLPQKYFLEHKDAEALAQKIKELAGENRPDPFLRSIVVRNHNIIGTIDKIFQLLNSR